MTAAEAQQPQQEDEVVELVTCRSNAGSYVYVPLPPATSYGHRAELWNVDNWSKEVRTKVVSAGDNLYVRLEELETGVLFAECPLPSDGTPLTTAVEPVVDSSRYYVLRIEDRESKKHAFIGLGFRDRNESSDFAAALDEYRQYLRRKKEAMQMRKAFEQADSAPEAADTSGGEGGPCSPGPAAAAADLSLQGSITINLKSKHSGGGDGPRLLSRNLSIPLAGGLGALKLTLPPPPPPSGGKASSGTAASISAGGQAVAPAGSAVAAQGSPTGGSGQGVGSVEVAGCDAMRRLSLSQVDAVGLVGGAGGSAPANGQAAESAAKPSWADDPSMWGEFVG